MLNNKYESEQIKFIVLLYLVYRSYKNMHMYKVFLIASYCYCYEVQFDLKLMDYSVKKLNSEFLDHS